MVSGDIGIGHRPIGRQTDVMIKAIRHPLVSKHLIGQTWEFRPYAKSAFPSADPMRAACQFRGTKTLVKDARNAATPPGGRRTPGAISFQEVEAATCASSIW